MLSLRHIALFFLGGAAWAQTCSQNLGMQRAGTAYNGPASLVAPGGSVLPLKWRVAIASNATVQNLGLKISAKDGRIRGKLPATIATSDYSFVVDLVSGNGAVQSCDIQVRVEPRETAAPVQPAPALTPIGLYPPGTAPAIIRGQLAAGQSGIYATIVPPAANEAVRASVRVNGHQANLRLVNGSIQGSVLAPAGDIYLPLETSLIAGDCVQIEQNRVIDTNGRTSLSKEECVIDPFDFGRLRYYFTGGALLSKDRDDFSKTDLFMSFSLDKNYVLSNLKGWNRIRLNTYFDTRLTAIPVTERTTATITKTTTTTPANGGGSGTTTNTNPNSVDSFLATKKAASLQVGAYVPITTTQWRYRDSDFSLFIAPIAKLGFVTPTDTSDTAGALTTGPTTTTNTDTNTTTDTSTTILASSIVNPNRFFTFYGFGGRLGHFREFKKNGEFDTSMAPELLSFVDIMTGRFGNFESYRDETPILKAAGKLPADYTTPNIVRKRLYRLAVEGLLKIPSTPFVVGFSANIGLSRQHEPGFSQVKDDLRFLFGVRFDVRRLVQKLSELK